MAATRDYSLNGAETKRAWERGLVSAEWYKTPVPRERMKALMKRSDFSGALARAVVVCADRSYGRHPLSQCGRPGGRFRQSSLTA